MLGCYDFCAHYDWTFRWLWRHGGRRLLEEYRVQAIAEDSQRHAARDICRGGLAGMAAYWGRTLAEEAPRGGYRSGPVGDRFVIVMSDCLSRGFLRRNRLDFSGDYCDHCLGWIGPLMRRAGYRVNHAHDHAGQCYWEMAPVRGGRGLHRADEARLGRPLRRRRPRKIFTGGNVTSRCSTISAGSPWRHGRSAPSITMPTGAAAGGPHGEKRGRDATR